jgi:ABC transporter substrate binding protein
VLGGAAAWPLAARAQQRTMPVIGFLHAASFSAAAPQMDGLRKGVGESGYVVGRNLTIEYRLAEGRYDRLPALATGGRACYRRRQCSCASGQGHDRGYSDCIRHRQRSNQGGARRQPQPPGGNITGVSMLLSELMAKCLNLVHQLVPNAAVIGALVNPDYSDADLQLRELQEAARAIKLPICVVSASTEGGIDAAFAILAEQRAAALLVANDLLFISRRDQIVAQAARHALPAIYNTRDYIAAGGLRSYAPSLEEAYRQAGIYTGTSTARL